ncbi:MAG: hypothetical protein ACRD2N_01435 [Vicinamibacterales bacterium]
MKKLTVGPNRRSKTLEEVMTVRFKAVFDSVVRLREQWERAIQDVQRTQAADLRVTRLVLRDHNQRIVALEKRPTK